ncbi:unnamed protein product [Boreogadus saida]
MLCQCNIKPCYELKDTQNPGFPNCAFSPLSGSPLLCASLFLFLFIVIWTSLFLSLIFTSLFLSLIFTSLFNILLSGD